MQSEMDFNFDPRIAVARLASGYGEATGGANPMAAAFNRIAQDLNWRDEARGAFGKVIPRGARVVVKPNWVIHENHGPWGIEPLITHASLIRTVVEELLRAEPEEVLVGDAPMQSCDFDKLMDATGLVEWAEALAGRERRFKGLRDFRRTTCEIRDGVRTAAENLQPLDGFVLFDLGRDSLLEPITDERAAFRVTCYDPRLMAQTHAAGRHQYLLARDVIEANVVINLPKLKTHKKAGVTCALKNLIGINGNKEYLPHHRIGGAPAGGDCYPEASPIKRALEFVHDRQNMTVSPRVSKLWHGMTLPLNRLLHMRGDELGIEGAWSGNDTIWRTCLDLNRILLYGRADATLADHPQRSVLHIVDAVIAGQGDGPLSPQPLPMGLIFAGQNAAAIDLVGARLLGYDPSRIPIIREAFGHFRWPLVTARPEEIQLSGDLGRGPAQQLLQTIDSPAPITYPVGWRDAVARNND